MSNRLVTSYGKYKLHSVEGNSSWEEIHINLCTLYVRDFNATFLKTCPLASCTWLKNHCFNDWTMAPKGKVGEVGISTEVDKCLSFLSFIQKSPALQLFTKPNVLLSNNWPKYSINYQVIYAQLLYLILHNKALQNGKSRQKEQRSTNLG